MSVLLLAYLVVAMAGVVILPRRWSFVPLIATVCLVPRVGVELGPLSFSVLRLLICLGAVRIIARREGVAGRVNRLDLLMFGWAALLMLSIPFHKDPGALVITRSGNVLDALGLYVLARTSWRTREDINSLVKLVAVLFVVLAIGMAWEKATTHNPFSLLGGVPEVPVVRGGKARAQGPFDVSILAGTVAAGFIPLFLGIWPVARLRAVIGSLSALAIVYASTSSGPILTAAIGLAALLLWPMRRQMWAVRWSLVAAYVALSFVMNDPPYYLMAKIDLTGSSTGWHRAAILDAAILHWREWVFTGTDRTIHWMPYGIPWSSDHTDITNQYLQMGVLGGFVLMAVFIGSVAVAFAYLGRELHRRDRTMVDHWLAWTIGASLAAHAVTFMSIAYYDQSMAFFYVDLAMAATLAVQSASRPARIARKQSASASPSQTVPGLPSTTPALAKNTARRRLASGDRRYS